MKGKRTKRYIGLALGMLFALYSAATPLGSLGVRAAGGSPSEARGGIEQGAAAVEAPDSDAAASEVTGAPIFYTEERPAAQEEGIAAYTESGEQFTKTIASGFKTGVQGAQAGQANWTAEGAVTLAADGSKATITGGGYAQRLYYGAKIEADVFRVEMKITPNMTEDQRATAPDLKLVFSGVPDCTSQRMNVRLHFKDASNDTPTIYIANYLAAAQNKTDANRSLIQVGNENSSGRNQSALTWQTGQEISLAIEVHKTDKIVKVFQGENQVSFTGTPVFAPAYAMDYFAIEGQFANQNFEISNLSITAKEAAPPPHTQLYSSYTCELIKDDFTNGNNWDVITPASGAGVISFENGKAILKTSSYSDTPNNRIGYNKGKILADKFLIQMDVTPRMNLGENGDLRIAFKAAANYEDTRMSVRLSANNKSVTLDTMTGDAKKNQIGTKSQRDLAWMPGSPFGLDIAVDTAAKTIKVYINGDEYLSQNCPDAMIADKGYLSIAGQYGQHHFEIDNLVVTTDERIAPMSRELLRDDFGTGDNWKINNSAVVKIADGKAAFQGGGPENRMGYQKGKINARDMLIQFDLTTGAGNTNAAAFAAFRYATKEFTGDRMHVKFDFKNGLVNLERLTDITPVNYTTSYKVSQHYDFATGGPYAVDILVKGNNLKVFIDKSKVLDATDDNIAALAPGYFAIIGKFSAQDFSIDNLLITTDEAQTGTQYTVTCQSSTDGVVGNATGGTVTADKASGYDGDVVTLTANPATGYLFEKFTLQKADGTSADLSGNEFALEAGNGNVTVVAHFVKREKGRYELFFDDFGGAALNAQYKVKDSGNGVTQAGGVLTISGANDGDFLLLPQGIFKDLKTEEGYRISVDVTRTTGTLQIMFRGTDTSINDRHVLGLNGDIAFIKPFVGGTGSPQNLVQANYTLGAQKVHMEIEVQGNAITCYAGGSKILEYTSTDNWKNQNPAVGLINMTPSAPVAFDNLLVERIPAKVALSTKIMLRNGETMTEDKTATAGTFSLSTSSAVEGDVITLNALAKNGYRLAECYVDDTKEKITGVSYTLPTGASGSICLVAVFEPAAPGAARDCYIDSAGGSDANPGTIAAPWQSFKPLQSLVLAPGSRIYLKRGSVFEQQQLAFKGMGTKEKPITIDAYGSGNLPKLAGGGEVENVVYLYNQEYITIRNLEITNTSPLHKSTLDNGKQDNKTLPLRAIRVVAKDFGVVSGIHIQDCYIHDINGNLLLKWNGGIFFDVEADIVGGAKQTFTVNGKQKEWLVGAKIAGVPTKYDDVLIEGCTFINVDRSAVKLVNSRWCNQWEPNNGDTPVNWYPSTNVVVRNNYLEKIGGDGITVRDTDGALIEHNLARDCRYKETGYNVAIWPFQAANTVIQYNEAYDTHSTQDGQGFDCDHASSYSLMQYNYSHNNQGGFMLIMGGYPHTAATVRYNISQNDKDKAFEFSQGIPKGVMIYNNTIYSGTKLDNGIFHLGGMAANCQVTEKLNDFYAFNNIFCYPSGQTTYYSGGEGSQISSKAHLYNNAYVGGIAPPAEEKNIDADTKTKLTIADAASVFMDAGKAPEANDTRKPRTGDSGALDGYKLKAGSALIDAGVTVDEAIAYFRTKGNVADSVLDRRDKSPRELFNEAENKPSLNYVMGGNFPKIAGVRYDLDFFGNPNKEGEKPDIGAAESLKHDHAGGGKATCSAKAVCDTCGVPYGSLDPANHAGGTEIRDARAAAAAWEGYTGDAYCLGCGEKLASGTAIARLPGGADDDSDDGPAAPAPAQPAVLQPVVKNPDRIVAIPASVPATAGKLTVAAAASERLPDDMELRMAEIPAEQKAVLEQQVAKGEHQEIFDGLRMEYVEIQLVQTQGGRETQVHDRPVTFVISLPKGVTKSNYRDHHFFALHLKGDGSTELLQPEATKDGLLVTSTLSSFAIGYGLHEEDGGITVKEPTEAAEGQVAYSCTACGTLVRTAVLPALGQKEPPAAPAAPSAEAPGAEAGGGISIFAILLCLAVLAAGGGACAWVIVRKRKG